ncbi:MAG TPA: response regulator transcription factor [Blastocatellia bacterium]|nr:response regulator transcription factor [Blastocatellia bacterium]
MPDVGKEAIRILLVDDHAVVRTGLRMLIQSEPGMSIVGEAANREEAISLATSQQPDVILLDLDLGSDNGLELIPEILKTAERSRVIVLTGMRNPDLYRQAVMQGALAVVPKDKTVEVIISAIKKVRDGEAWLDPVTMAGVLNEMARANKPKPTDPESSKITSLTDREREVVALIGEGLKNKQIADRLFISETTVRHHLTSIFSKLEVSDRVELLIYSYRHGLAEPPTER